MPLSDSRSLQPGHQPRPKSPTPPPLAIQVPPSEAGTAHSLYVIRKLQRSGPPPLEPSVEHLYYVLDGVSAWSKCPLGSARARLLRLLRARLAALGSSALPGRGLPTRRPATASDARASRLQSRPIHGQA